MTAVAAKGLSFLPLLDLQSTLQLSCPELPEGALLTSLGTPARIRTPLQQELRLPLKHPTLLLFGILSSLYGLRKQTGPYLGAAVSSRNNPS